MAHHGMGALHMAATEDLLHYRPDTPAEWGLLLGAILLALFFVVRGLKELSDVLGRLFDLGNTVKFAVVVLIIVLIAAAQGSSNHGPLP